MPTLHRLLSVRPQLSILKLNFFVALWLSTVPNLIFYQQIAAFTPYHGLKAGLFIMATFVVVFSLYSLLLQLINWRITAVLFSAILIFVAGLSAYFVSSFGVTISADQIQNMLQTEAREVRDLLSLRFLLWTICLVILPCLLLIRITIKQQPITKTIREKCLAIVSSLVLICALLFVYYVDFAAIFREHRDLKGMLSPQNTIASSFSYWHKQAPKQNLALVRYGTDAHLTAKVTQAHKPKLMVLVLGETARAESFSLNGYAKNTNPELAKLNIINFKQVSSCGTATAVSVPCMFSGMPRRQYDEQLASHREGLLDIAQRAGYKVTWIDNNSGCKGTCNRVEQYQPSAELKQKWCKDDECLDELLVDSLKAYIAQIPTSDHQARLIVLHQMGSHGPAYYKRSKSGYQPFKPTCDTNAIQGCSSQQLLNSYDNSIVYTDHVLSELILQLQGNQQYTTALWYLSDHGESTGEHGLYLHGAPYAIAPSQQTHVPMLMWFSQAWQSQHADQVQCLTQQKNANLSQDHLFPTMLSLLGIHSQVIDPNYNIIKGCTHSSLGRA